MKLGIKSSSVVIAASGLAWLITAGAAIAQVEQAHLRIDGMT